MDKNILSFKETKNLIDEAKEHFKKYIVESATPKEKYQSLRAFVYGYFSAKGVAIVDPGVLEKGIRLRGEKLDLDFGVCGIKLGEPQEN